MTGPCSRPPLLVSCRSIGGDGMRGIASRWVGAVATVAAAVTGAAVAPQPPGAVIVVDPANRPAIFAAGELRTAFEARGIRVTTAVVADLPRQTAPVQVVITTANSPVADRPGVSGLQPQGYAIRRVAAGPVTRWWADRRRRSRRDVCRAGTGRGRPHRRRPRRDGRPPGQSGHRQPRHQVQHSRSTRARPAIRTTRRRRRPTSPRCGAWTSGRRCSTRWRGIATTCCRSGA